MNRLWPDGRLARLVVVLLVMVMAALVYRGIQRNSTPIATRPELLQPVDQSETHSVAEPDTRTYQLPPLNRELVVLTDSDIQSISESRQDLINRPDPL